MIGKNILHIFFNKPAKLICKFFWKTTVGRMNYISLLQNKPNIYVNSREIHDWQEYITYIF